MCNVVCLRITTNEVPRRGQKFLQIFLLSLITGGIKKNFKKKRTIRPFLYL